MLIGDFLLIELRSDILRRLQRFLHFLRKFIRSHASSYCSNVDGQLDLSLVVRSSRPRLQYGHAPSLSSCRRLLVTLSCRMPAQRNRPKRDNFNVAASLPFQLRLEDFEIAMQDVYDLFHDINTGLLEKGLERLDDFSIPTTGRSIRFQAVSIPPSARAVAARHTSRRPANAGC